MSLTLKQIQAFLAVAELGSFTRASQRLRIAQPALSQQVRELEQAIGLRLFDRTTRRVELTAAGNEFRESVAKIVEDLDLAVAQARDLAERRRGRLTLAAPPLLAGTLLPKVMAQFAAGHPGVRVVLMDARTDEILERVTTGQADCGIGTFAPADDGLERLALARDRLMLFCPPAHDFAARPSCNWADLEPFPMIALTRDSGLRMLAEVGFQAAGGVLRPAFEVSQITTALAMVAAGLGLAVLPAYARAAAREEAVVARPLGAPEIARDIVVIRPHGRAAPPSFPDFLAVLRRAAQSLG